MATEDAPCLTNMEHILNTQVCVCVCMCVCMCVCACICEDGIY